MLNIGLFRMIWQCIAWYHALRNSNFETLESLLLQTFACGSNFVSSMSPLLWRLLSGASVQTPREALVKPLLVNKQQAPGKLLVNQIYKPAWMLGTQAKATFPKNAFETPPNGNNSNDLKKWMLIVVPIRVGSLAENHKVARHLPYLVSLLNRSYSVFFLNIVVLHWVLSNRSIHASCDFLLPRQWTNKK